MNKNYRIIWFLKIENTSGEGISLTQHHDEIKI